MRKESVSLAGPGLILVRLRGTEHASANLRLPIANAKRFSLSSGAGRLYARIVAPLESIYSLEHFLSILFRSHPQSHQIAATSRRLSTSLVTSFILPFRSPSHLLARAHTYTHTYTTLTHSIRTYTRTFATACDYRSTESNLAEGFRKITHSASGPYDTLEL